MRKNWERNKRHEKAEKNKCLKQKKNENEKIEEKEHWDKLNNLNKEFQAIGYIKKKQKTKTILK